MDAWNWLDLHSTRRVIVRFCDAEDQGSPLRVGKGDDFAEEPIARIPREVASRDPRIWSPTFFW